MQKKLWFRVRGSVKDRLADTIRIKNVVDFLCSEHQRRLIGWYTDALISYSHSSILFHCGGESQAKRLTVTSGGCDAESSLFRALSDCERRLQLTFSADASTESSANTSSSSSSSRHFTSASQTTTCIQLDSPCVHLCRTRMTTHCKDRQAEAKFSEYEVWDKVPEGSTLISKFPCNTVKDRPEKASMPKTSWICLAVLLQYRIVTDTDKWAQRQSSMANTLWVRKKTRH